MADRGRSENRYLSQKKRLLALFLYILILLLVSKLVTGELFPSESGKRLWLLSGIGLWFFALISAPWFRPPRDALANAVTAALLLSFLDIKGVGLLEAELSAFRWLAVGYAVFTAIAALAAMMLYESDDRVRPRLESLSRLGFRLSDSLGKGEILFTPPALISIVGYYQHSLPELLWLVLAWCFLVTIKPVDLAFRIVDQLRRKKKGSTDMRPLGTISRIDNPNIIRVTLESPSFWKPGEVVVACLPDSTQSLVLPLFHHIQESHAVGTGLCCGKPGPSDIEAKPGYVYQSRSQISVSSLIDSLSGNAGSVELIGFVVEDSNISTIKFEVAPESALEEGTLILCRQCDMTVYYQILDARTAEESFEKNPRGKHVAVAAQLGCLDNEKGFVKYGWVPSMNTPVFAPKEKVRPDATKMKRDEFIVGKIPGSEIGVSVGFYDMLEFHCAILGMTGTGKTELAFDIVRKALDLDAKVFCVDFTEEYKTRLSDCNPLSLGLEREIAEELNKKLFAVDTTAYGAPEEKKALKEFVDEIRKPINTSVQEFLETEGASLGVFELPEITNTKATLRATELYLSSIMDWARRNRRARRILVVLEEAHTIIPETMGSGFDYDTQWVVSRISQIALQGRKYGVGLLLLSQRTALVSKSILSQCNTHFTFSLVDKTSLEYLANVHSPDHIRVITNLRFLEAVAFGKAVRSERPLIVKLDYDPAKKEASDALDRIIETPDSESEEQ